MGAPLLRNCHDCTTPREPFRPRPARRDRPAAQGEERGHPGALLPEARDSGSGRFRRGFARAVAHRGGDRCRCHRLLRRQVHGRNRQDPLAGQDRDPARHGRGLFARGQLPAGQVRRLPRRAPGPYRADVHQLLDRGEGALRHHRHLVLGRKDPEPDPGGPEDHLRPRQASGRLSPAQAGREMLLWPGVCIVHEAFSETELLKLKAQHPDAPVAAHPECPAHIIDHADMVDRPARS